MPVLKTTFTEIRRVSNRRLAICRECSSYNSNTDQCKECGCFMHIKTKFPYVSCPLGKWDKE